MENKTPREIIKPILQNWNENWKKDYTFKTIASSLLSFGITILFALYNGFLGIRLLSLWNGSICVFYLLLVLIRGIILFAERKSKGKPDSEKAHIRYKVFVISTIMLLLLNFALICPIALMVKLEKPVNMELIPAIAMAAYTTYKVTMASINFCKKSRRHKNVFITELRTINFIDALVSILTLQNTLIMVNSTKSGTDKMLTLSAITSAVIYIIIVFITLRLLTGGMKQHRKEIDSTDKA